MGSSYKPIASCDSPRVGSNVEGERVGASQSRHNYRTPPDVLIIEALPQPIDRPAVARATIFDSA